MIAVVVTALAGLMPAPAVASGSTVSVEATRMLDLGTLGGQNSYAGGLNVWGHVAGTADTSGGWAHAFRWTPSGGMQDLGTLGGRNSYGADINVLGQIVGASEYEVGTEGETRAFRWTPSGGMQDLGTLDGGSTGAAAINNRGQVVGFSYLSNGYSRAFLWTPSAGIRDLGTLGGPSSIAYDINDVGQVTGFADAADGSSHAFRWTPSGGMQDLGVLNPGTWRTAINARGQVIGRGYRGFLWTPSGGRQDLGFAPAAINARGQVAGDVTGGETQFVVRWTPPGTVRIVGEDSGRSWAYGINDVGQVTGQRFAPRGGPQAFFWTASTGITDLGTLGGDSSSPSEINIRGQVVGSADTADSRTHAFLWSP
ncbi:hypothetical protein ACLQ2Q_15895 [Microbacterium sp. DT81.1]|uniref:hypothetical protein n=1 Tax=Microbacterium sp. DT81.1 TaxID=3393413 RepID=UPI003CF8DEA4